MTVSRVLTWIVAVVRPKRARAEAKRECRTAWVEWRAERKQRPTPPTREAP